MDTSGMMRDHDRLFPAGVDLRIQHNSHCLSRLLWLALHDGWKPLNLRESGERFQENWTRP